MKGDATFLPGFDVRVAAGGLVSALLLSVFVGGCAAPDEDIWATRMIGPDGRIVTLPGRAPGLSRRVQHAVVNEPPVVADYWWRDDGGGGPPRIVIDLGEQRAFFYRGERVVGETPISSGREGYHTPAGSFRVTQKNRDHVSNLYGDYVDAAGNVIMANVGVRRDPRPPGTRFRGAPMPYFMRIHGAVGLHAGYLPGYPASHGCIRLPMEMAQKFFENAPLGTPVVVKH